jgi:glycosyltransferase involved in cell wall biosynthesis
MNERGPLLICSRPFPPKIGGSSILSRNLWGVWPAGDLVVLSQMYPDENVDQKLALPDVKIHYAPTWWSRFPRLRAMCAALLAWPIRREVIRVARQCRPRALWVNWPPTQYLLGTWLASKALKLPLYVHMHDMWGTALTSPKNMFDPLVSRLLQGRILRDARRVFAITEDASAHFRETYGTDCYVLKHCIPDADYQAGQELAYRDPVEPVIHFAGYIFAVMNLDAVLNLVHALDLCQSEVSLDGYTFNPEGCRSMGVQGQRVSLRTATKKEVMTAQRKSAILFLPLAFQSSNPEEIRTVFPTKLLEYFVSGRPILVHAPADSWASRSARKYGWGEVVDEPDPKRLAVAIDRLMKDEDRQKSLVAAAYEEARRRLASNVVRELQQELGRLEGAQG